MGTIQVEFFSLIQMMTEERYHEVSFEKEPLTLRDLLNIIIDVFGPRLKEALFDLKSGQLKPMIMVAINGRNSFFLEGMETSLKDGDKVAIGVVAAGG
ncbi:MAG: MoaD/ThiS family protein [Pseudomonadota bacterium]